MTDRCSGGFGGWHKSTGQAPYHCHDHAGVGGGEGRGRNKSARDDCEAVSRDHVKIEGKKEAKAGGENASDW